MQTEVQHATLGRRYSSFEPRLGNHGSSGCHVKANTNCSLRGSAFNVSRRQKSSDLVRCRFLQIRRKKGLASCSAHGAGWEYGCVKTYWHNRSNAERKEQEHRGQAGEGTSHGSAAETMRKQVTSRGRNATFFLSTRPNCFQAVEAL